MADKEKEDLLKNACQEGWDLTRVNSLLDSHLGFSTDVIDKALEAYLVRNEKDGKNGKDGDDIMKALLRYKVNLPESNPNAAYPPEYREEYWTYSDDFRVKFVTNLWIKEVNQKRFRKVLSYQNLPIARFMIELLDRTDVIHMVSTWRQEENERPPDKVNKGFIEACSYLLKWFTFRMACANGNLDEVKNFIENERGDPTLDSSHGLSLASLNGHLRIVEYLLEKGSDPVKSRALYWASKSDYSDDYIKNKRFKLVQLLLEKGSDPVESKVLYWATLRGRDDIVKYLLESNYVTSGGKEMQTAIEIAYDKRYTSTFLLLFKDYPTKMWFLENLGGKFLDSRKKLFGYTNLFFDGFITNVWGDPDVRDLRNQLIWTIWNKTHFHRFWWRLKKDGLIQITDDGKVRELQNDKKTIVTEALPIYKLDWLSSEQKEWVVRRERGFFIALRDKLILLGRRFQGKRQLITDIPKTAATKGREVVVCKDCHGDVSAPPQKNSDNSPPGPNKVP